MAVLSAWPRAVALSLTIAERQPGNKRAASLTPTRNGSVSSAMTSVGIRTSGKRSSKLEPQTQS